MRLTNRQNIVFRDLTEAQLPTLYARLEAIGMAEPGAELARDVVACPGADTCNLAVTQSRGLADAIGTALEEAGLAEVGGVRTNISGCTNSCGQHHVADIGFFGAERRAHGQPAPGYQMLLGGYVGQEQMHFGAEGPAPPGQATPPRPPSGSSRRFAERARGRRGLPRLDRALRRRQGHRRRRSSDLDDFPTPDEAPELLRRLRRDRALRGRDRRIGVRDMSNATVFTGAGSDGFDSQPKSPDDFTDAELAELSVEFERLPATKIIQWAVDNFAPHLALTASMTDAVLIDLAVKVYPAIEVVFIDTGYHFPETLETVEEVRRRYGLNLKIMTVARQDEELWKVDPENCCSAVKVGQLDRALLGKSAWMSGLRRSEADTRIKAPLVARDLRGLIKVNPHRHVDRRGRRRLHRRPRRAGQPADRPGLPVDRLHALHRSPPPTPTIPARAAGPAATRRSAASTRCSPGKLARPRGGEWEDSVACAGASSGRPCAAPGHGSGSACASWWSPPWAPPSWCASPGPSSTSSWPAPTPVPPPSPRW